MLIDSDVLVWLTRGHVGAAELLRALPSWKISTVTYIELAQGCRNKDELMRLKKGLAARYVEIVPITPAISDRAAELIDSLALSHGLRLADALIAATAIEQQGTLITANAKHFASVPSLAVEAFKPWQAMASHVEGDGCWVTCGRDGAAIGDSRSDGASDGDAGRADQSAARVP